jgi:hypothetical protein
MPSINYISKCINLKGVCVGNFKICDNETNIYGKIYSYMIMYSSEDGRKQLTVYQKKSNNFIKTCLNMQSPNQVVMQYIGVMQVLIKALSR